MGMSHEHCNHPRTPAGRAACRKAGGPGATSTTPVRDANGVTDPKTIGAMMARNERAGRRSTAQDRRMNAASEMVRESFGTTDTPPATKTRTRASQAASRTRGVDPSYCVTCGVRNCRTHRATRSRAIRAVHDMADVPHVFSSVIKWAWDNGAEVRTGNPYNDREQNIKVKTEAGEATLAWRSSHPNGVYGVWFRPRRSSVSTRLATVNEVTRLLAG